MSEVSGGKPLGKDTTSSTAESTEEKKEDKPLKSMVINGADPKPAPVEVVLTSPTSDSGKPLSDSIKKAAAESSSSDTKNDLLICGTQESMYDGPTHRQTRKNQQKNVVAKVMTSEMGTVSRAGPPSTMGSISKNVRANKRNRDTLTVTMENDLTQEMDTHEAPRSKAKERVRKSTTSRGREYSVEEKSKHARKMASKSRGRSSNKRSMRQQRSCREQRSRSQSLREKKRKTGKGAHSLQKTVTEGLSGPPRSSDQDSHKEKRKRASHTPTALSRRQTGLADDDANRDLENQEYYHGFRPRKDVVGLLKEPGDFLVRATDARNKPEVIISVLNDKKELLNFTIRVVLRKWQLGGIRRRSTPMPRFVHVDDLIKHYKDHGLPGRVRLRRAISRPAWVIRHEDVLFDRTKDLIGNGNFCDVYKGIYLRTPKERIEVAIKIGHERYGTDKEFEESKAAREQMLEEAQMMSYYVHSHIVQMFGVACGRAPVLIVMEFCPGGNLELHLKAQRNLIETGERIIYALEASRGMVFLHRKNCIHRDLAARNCLISSKGLIKISDFGLSKLADELEKMDATVLDEHNPQIPLRWMAPESLKRPMKFSAKTDVWSFAVMLFEIFNLGEKPWVDEPPKKVATMIRRCRMPTFPELTPSEITQLASRIWVLNPDDRPNMKDVSFVLMKVSKEIKPPDSENFSLNKLDGVRRTSVTPQYSLEDTAECEEVIDGATDEGSLRTRTTSSQVPSPSVMKPVAEHNSEPKN
ncbi:hypothetical protein Q1695_009547 [Nippostrongylus brasiliensis]|nr:hypothetical protein Q1695_009547 [Nippostrongylus brasiliensis]